MATQAGCSWRFDFQSGRLCCRSRHRWMRPRNQGQCRVVPLAEAPEFDAIALVRASERPTRATAAYTQERPYVTLLSFCAFVIALGSLYGPNPWGAVAAPAPSPDEAAGGAAAPCSRSPMYSIS
jgi:hypothetical protein